MRSIKFSKNKGFSLLEILIAMVISSIILLAIIRLFSRVGEMFDDNAASMQLMETTRIAMKFIRGDLVQAGYLGCILTDMDDSAEMTNVKPTISNTDIENNLLGIWGDNGSGTNPDTLSLFYQQDLDIRVLHNDTNGDFTSAPSIFVDAVNVFDGSGNPIIDQGDWLIASNCVAATVFVLTNTPSELSEAAFANISPSGITANGTVSALQYGLGVTYDGYSNTSVEPIERGGWGFLASGGAAMISRFVQVTYEVADSEIDGGETKSLYRLVNGEARSKNNEMIRLVEDFQVEYGIDDDSDGVVDQFNTTFNSSTDKVVMVKVSVKISDGTRVEDLENVVKLRNKGL